jgi:hypothetical protein
MNRNGAAEMQLTARIHLMPEPCPETPRIRPDETRNKEDEAHSCTVVF